MDELGEVFEVLCPFCEKVHRLARIDLVQLDEGREHPESVQILPIYGRSVLELRVENLAPEPVMAVADRLVEYASSKKEDAA